MGDITFRIPTDPDEPGYVRFHAGLDTARRTFERILKGIKGGRVGSDDIVDLVNAITLFVDGDKEIARETVFDMSMNQLFRVVTELGLMLQKAFPPDPDALPFPEDLTRMR